MKTTKILMAVVMVAVAAAPIQATHPTCNLGTGASCGTTNGCPDFTMSGPWIKWSCYLGGFRCQTVERQAVACPSGTTECRWQLSTSRMTVGCMPADCTKNSGCL